MGYENSILQGRDYEGGPLKAMRRADAITVGVSGGFTFEDDSKSNDELKNRFGDLVSDIDITKQYVPWSENTDNTLIGKAVYALAVQTPKNMMGIDGGEWVWK
ncbi:hypothetical protein ACJJIK_03635 [Microbulbifer sp. ZKSA006]|uniref:hypothetical protein n=1 Tax=Microbulbifer sp. ZKSA006 TaxID=3243390 RepID=UPI004039097E